MPVLAVHPDSGIDATRPEALVYAPGANGRVHLAAYDYLVFKADWDASHDSPPSPVGETFNFTDSPRRYGLPPYYSLHAWLRKRDPAGMFELSGPPLSGPGRKRVLSALRARLEVSGAREAL